MFDIGSHMGTDPNPLHDSNSISLRAHSSGKPKKKPGTVNLGYMSTDIPLMNWRQLDSQLGIPSSYPSLLICECLSKLIFNVSKVSQLLLKNGTMYTRSELVAAVNNVVVSSLSMSLVIELTMGEALAGFESSVFQVVSLWLLYHGDDNGDNRGYLMWMYQKHVDWESVKIWLQLFFHPEGGHISSTIEDLDILCLLLNC
ncbi:hypothetical protein BDA99DRAFT_532821 [Phascolomyces articulosus]|uniref:Uncharacterized protein n=1 Tax=Phascolomyces articulosus TaxID=60185 RepID=A0AAD5PIV0_9FUNG|nr:hypothetical protein BDA99DRAFT_532821 [Phascolomyces articulosus]